MPACNNNAVSNESHGATMSRILCVFVAVLPLSFQSTDFRIYKFTGQQNNSAHEGNLLRSLRCSVHPRNFLYGGKKIENPLPRVVLRPAQALCAMCTPLMQTSCTHTIKIK